jgi:spore maturation protein CgeB
MHSSRLPLLEAVARAVPDLRLHGNVTIHVAADSPLAGRIRPPLWGRDMYALLRRSQITLNHHGDVLPYANNMRMYEATGMGCLLVTDYKDNLGEIFEPEKEVVTYRSAEECVDKLRFYLDDRHAAARNAIMAAGHRRTLSEHNYDARMRRLVNLIEAGKPS